MHPTSPIPIATHDPRSPHATIALDPRDLLRSLYVVGKTGTGKSALLLRVLLGAVGAGFGMCLIDPHGDLARQALEQLPSRHWNRVVSLRPADADRPVGLNLLARAGGTPRALLASGIVEVFRKLWGPVLFGPRSEHLLRNAVLALLEYPGATLLGVLRLLVEEEYRMRVLSRVTDPVVKVFWLREFPALGRQFTAEVTAPVLNKLGALASPVARRVVGQVSPRVDLREVMDEGRLLVCDLSRIGRDAAQLLGALLVTGIDVETQARAATPARERRPFILVADEFQTYTTPSFLHLLAESRKFAVCAALAHQHFAQLDDGVRAAILGNVGSVAAFAMSAADAALLRPELAPEVGIEELVRLRRHHVALRLMRGGETGRPVVCRTLAPPPENGGPPAALLRISAERYGRPAAVVDREIAESLGTSLARGIA